MDDQERAELIAQAEVLQDALTRASELIDPVRPSAADLACRVCQCPDFASEEVWPGATHAEVAEQCAEAVESVVGALAAASGNLALLTGSLIEEE